MGQFYDTAWNFGHAWGPTAIAAIVWFWRKLNGNFFAALFGAWGAYRLAARSERRNKLREELVATNNAMGMAINILNVMLAVKGQFINSLADNYRRGFQQYFDGVVAPQPAGQGPIMLQWQGDLRILNAPQTVADELQRWILDRVTRSPAAPMVVASLRRSVQLLTNVLERRTRLIEAMRQQPENIRVMLYWGLPDANGNVDDSYPDTMTAMVEYVNDSIYFSELMLEILAKHGAALRKAYGKGAPKVLELHLTDPRVAPLLPDRTLYPDFELQFRKPDPVVGRWTRFKAWLSRLFDAK